MECRPIDNTEGIGFAGTLMDNTEGNGFAVVFMVKYEYMHAVK